MAGVPDFEQLCRICLVKEQVNIAIFEDRDSAAPASLKISTCLPVKVSQDDDLPKKICDGCSYKLDMFYEFWNTSSASEKQLLEWLSELESPSKPIIKSVRGHSDVVLKQEVIDLGDTNVDDDDLHADDLNVSNDAQDYILQQQQLPYQTTFEFEQDGFTEGQVATVPSATVTSEIAKPKRKRRAAAMRAIPRDIDSEDEDDAGLVGTKIAKTEEHSDDSAEDPSFADLPSTSADEQPGPSGVGKGGTDASSFSSLQDFSTLLSSKENWSIRLQEVDIIPLVKQEPFGDAVEKKPEKMKTPSQLGYKNPFVYLDCSAKPAKEFKPELLSSKWTCMICNEFAENKSALIDHYEKHKNEREKSDRPSEENVEDYFRCSVCGKEFTSSRCYEKHLEHKHGENRFVCEQCSKSYKNSFQLCVHSFNAHPVHGKYQCISCDFMTLNRTMMKAHLEKHEESYKYQCDVCDKKFCTPVLYDEHKNSHAGAMPFQCEVCLKSFPYSRYLISHKRSVHPEVYSGSGNVNKCGFCEKQFAHRKSLILHTKSHTGENTVLCDICGKNLSSTEHLKQHLRIHTGYKPHACAVCGKAFSKKSNLTLHERVHSGEKPYICQTCEKCFSQRSTLVIHERYHSGERPYTCPLCSKGFVAKGLLGVHLKSCSRIIQ